jgi:hypothetical protein
MADRKHTFGEKVREIIIEILIIVFAVTLSIYLHGWSEHRQRQKEVHEFLRGLKVDLADDIRLLRQSHGTITKVTTNFDFASHVRKGQLPDSTLHHYFYYMLIVTTLNNARYEGFKSNGKLGDIGNDSLREAILVYFQQTIPGIAYQESFVNELQQKILDFQLDKSDVSMNDFVASAKTKGLLGLSTQNLNYSLYMYDQAIGQAQKLIARIDQELRP